MASMTNNGEEQSGCITHALAIVFLKNIYLFVLPPIFDKVKSDSCMSVLKRSTLENGDFNDRISLQTCGYNGGYYKILLFIFLHISLKDFLTTCIFAYDQIKHESLFDGTDLINEDIFKEPHKENLQSVTNHISQLINTRQIKWDTFWLNMGSGKLPEIFNIFLDKIVYLGLYVQINAELSTNPKIQQSFVIESCNFSRDFTIINSWGEKISTNSNIFTFSIKEETWNATNFVFILPFYNDTLKLPPSIPLYSKSENIIMVDILDVEADLDVWVDYYVTNINRHKLDENPVKAKVNAPVKAKVNAPVNIPDIPGYKEKIINYIADYILKDKPNVESSVMTLFYSSLSKYTYLADVLSDLSEYLKHTPTWNRKKIFDFFNIGFITLDKLVYICRALGIDLSHIANAPVIKTVVTNAGIKIQDTPDMKDKIVRYIVEEILKKYGNGKRQVDVKVIRKKIVPLLSNKYQCISHIIGRINRLAFPELPYGEETPKYLIGSQFKSVFVGEDITLKVLICLCDALAIDLSSFSQINANVVSAPVLSVNDPVLSANVPVASAPVLSANAPVANALVASAPVASANSTNGVMKLVLVNKIIDHIFKDADTVKERKTIPHELFKKNVLDVLEQNEKLTRIMKSFNNPSSHLNGVWLMLNVRKIINDPRLASLDTLKEIAETLGVEYRGGNRRTNKRYLKTNTRKNKRNTNKRKNKLNTNKRKNKRKTKHN